MRYPRLGTLLLAGAVGVAVLGPKVWADPEIDRAAATQKAFSPIGDPHLLHNAHIVTDKVLSGAQPEGIEAFKNLQELGVKTVISVDGAKPDVESARQYGIRYVHIPIGYDGVSPDEARAIAKAIDEMPGRIYIHCHHGKHRSAAAVAVACVNLGMLKPNQAEAVLKTFGTGENYTGLWQAARDAKPVDLNELRAAKIEFVETAQIGDFAEHMVEVDRHWDNVKIVQKAGWERPKDHPDLDPAHEVLQTREHLFESGRLESTTKRGAAFAKAIESSNASLQSLHEVLSKKPVNITAADKAFKAAADSCVTCHKAFRD